MAKNNYALIAAIVSLLASSPVSAAVAKGKDAPGLPGTLSVTPTAGVYVFGGSEFLNPAPLLGVKLSYDLVGKTLADSLGIELTTNYFITSSSKGGKGGGSADGFIYRLDALYSFTPGKKIVPTAAIGMGGIQIRRGSSSDGDLVFNYGGGIKYFLEDWLALRADLRHLLVYNNIDTRNNFEFSIGVNYLFGKDHKKKEPPAGPKIPTMAVKALDDVAKKPAPKVVADRTLMEKLELSRTPALGITQPASPFKIIEPESTPTMGPVTGAPPTRPTPVGVAKPSPLERMPLYREPAPEASAPVRTTVPPAAVAPAPEPAAAPQAAAPPAATTLPRPATPAPQASATVPQAAPPEVEQEEPGTVEAPHEDLPEILALVEIPPATVTTPAPERPKAKEQQSARKVVKSIVIEFDTDSWTIKAKYYKVLKELAAQTKSSPGIRTHVEGHTDSSGEDLHNLRLSKRRADSVKEFLVKFGASGSRITTSAHGPKQPVAENKTRLGKQKNRRAVTIVTIARDKGAEAGDDK